MTHPDAGDADQPDGPEPDAPANRPGGDDAEEGVDADEAAADEGVDADEAAADASVSADDSADDAGAADDTAGDGAPTPSFEERADDAAAGADAPSAAAASGPVSTGCPPVDELLGGGFDRGTVTQLYGPPAAGKTNLALSAAVDVAAEGGVAVYLDTEGLSVDRFHQLLAGRTDDTEAAASRIAVSAVHDFAEQAEAVRDVAELAPAAELIVLDSATGFYRLERGDDDGETLRQVTSQVTHLLSLARRHDLAVVLTNQVYSDPEVEGTSAKPLGGHTLAHWTGVVLRLERFRGGRRRATLRQHGSRPAGESAEFQITETGLTGLDRR